MSDIVKFEKMMMFDLPDSEREMLRARLDALGKSFEALEEVDAGDVEPLVNVLSMENSLREASAFREVSVLREANVLREDVADKLLTREALLTNAPDRDGGFFKVPGTLD